MSKQQTPKTRLSPKTGTPQELRNGRWHNVFQESQHGSQDDRTISVPQDFVTEEKRGSMSDKQYQDTVNYIAATYIDTPEYAGYWVDEFVGDDDTIDYHELTGYFHHRLSTVAHEVFPDEFHAPDALENDVPDNVRRIGEEMVVSYLENPEDVFEDWVEGFLPEDTDVDSEDVYLSLIHI